MRRGTLGYIKQLAKGFSNHQTTAEQELWAKIRNKQLKGYRFLRQYALGRYITDFYCCKEKIAVEVDGIIHENDENKAYYYI